MIPSYVEISKEAKDFLDCCLQKNPDQRSNIRELLNHSFFKKYPEKNDKKMGIWYKNIYIILKYGWKTSPSQFRSYNASKLRERRVNKEVSVSLVRMVEGGDNIAWDEYEIKYGTRIRNDDATSTYASTSTYEHSKYGKYGPQHPKSNKLIPSSSTYVSLHV